MRRIPDGLVYVATIVALVLLCWVVGAHADGGAVLIPPVTTAPTTSVQAVTSGPVLIAPVVSVAGH